MGAAAELEGGQKLQGEGVGHGSVHLLPEDHAGQRHEQHDGQHQPQRGAGVLHLGPEPQESSHGSLTVRLGCPLGSAGSDLWAGVRSLQPRPLLTPLGAGPLPTCWRPRGRHARELLPPPRLCPRVLGLEPGRRGEKGRRAALLGHPRRGQWSAETRHAHALTHALRDWKPGASGARSRASGGHCACAGQPVRPCERLDLGPQDLGPDPVLVRLCVAWSGK